MIILCLVLYYNMIIIVSCVLHLIELVWLTKFISLPIYLGSLIQSRQFEKKRVSIIDEEIGLKWIPEKEMEFKVSWEIKKKCQLRNKNQCFLVGVVIHCCHLLQSIFSIKKLQEKKNYTLLLNNHSMCFQTSIYHISSHLNLVTELSCYQYCVLIKNTPFHHAINV